jgi:hypothetical protein
LNASWIIAGHAIVRTGLAKSEVIVVSRKTVAAVCEVTVCAKALNAYGCTCWAFHALGYVAAHAIVGDRRTKNELVIETIDALAVICYVAIGSHANGANY